MPKDDIRPEQDDDITTAYEDIGDHDRTGAVLDETDRVEIGNREDEHDN